jgi:hypothetical protein
MLNDLNITLSFYMLLQSIVGWSFKATGLNTESKLCITAKLVVFYTIRANLMSRERDYYNKRAHTWKSLLSEPAVPNGHIGK